MGSRATIYTALGLLEFGVVPLLSLALVPYVLHRLGAEPYGLWVTCNALILAVNLLCLGLPDWIVVRVGSDRARPDAPTRVAGLLGDTLVLGAVVGTVGAAFVLGVLLTTIGQGSPVARGAVVGLSVVTGAGALLRSLEIILLGFVRGLDRWDLAGAVGTSAKLANLINLAGMAYRGASVAVILVGQVAIAILTLIAYCLILRREIGQWPGVMGNLWKRASMYVREARPFWTHIGVSALVHSLDRALVSATFGLRAASGYAVCSQVTQQIYTLSWAGANWLVPRVARLAVAADRGAVRTIVRKGWALGMAFSLASVLSTVTLGSWFLRMWVGPAFALEWYPLLVMLSCAMALFALPIVPWYVVQAIGRAADLIPYYWWGLGLGAFVFLVLEGRVGVESVAIARGAVGAALAIGVVRALSGGGVVRLSRDVGAAEGAK